MSGAAPRRRQAVFLVGGLGTRLGELTLQTPKPLLEVGGRPFLDYLVEDVARHGFTDMLFLAQFEAEQVRHYCKNSATLRRFGISAAVVEEPNKAGTGGALWHARQRLADQFLLLNGDSWLQGNYLALEQQVCEAGTRCAVALRSVDDAGRYGLASLKDGRVITFAERGKEGQSGLINGGVYFMQRDVIESARAQCSLEADVLPQLAQAGLMAGEPFNGYFIDIGLPESFAQAQSEFEAAWRRPALFLDRDGVLNVDHGHVGSVDRLEWIEGACNAVRAANDKGHFVFVVTNQAGVAKGHYDEAAVEELHRHMQQTLHELGAHVDEFRYCPYHPEGIVEAYRRSSVDRKPGPGMLIDLISRWPVDQMDSLLVGDKPSDIQAADAAGIRGIIYRPPVPLDKFIAGAI